MAINLSKYLENTIKKQYQKKDIQNHGWEETKRADKVLFSLRSHLKRQISEIGQRFYSNKHQKQTKINKYLNK